jgi:hypothetical protein
MKAVSAGRRVWVEYAALAGLSAWMAALMYELFGRYRPTKSLLKNQLGDAAPTRDWHNRGGWANA